MAFAWEGLALDVNEDWAPTTISGRRDAGYVKLGDGSHRAIQIRWQEIRGAVDLESRLRTYLKKLDGDSRKRKVALSYELEAAENGIAYRYQGAFSGRGFASSEIDPKRVVFAEVSSTRSERLSNQHRKLLGTLRGCTHEDHETWSVLGLTVNLPLGCIPTKREFVSGKTRVIWRLDKSGIEAQRWGLAAQLMAKHTLTEWAESVTRLPVVSATEDHAILESKTWYGACQMAVVRYQADRNQLTVVQVSSRRESLRPDVAWIG